MGYALAMGTCYGCRRYFAFNPLRVPSITPPGAEERLPICRDCVERANPERLRRGLEPIVPAPDAYAPVAEEELG